MEPALSADRLFFAFLAKKGESKVNSVFCVGRLVVLTLKKYLKFFQLLGYLRYFSNVYVTSE
jgi:hypothetical protein